MVIIGASTLEHSAMPTQYVVLALRRVPRIFLDIIYIYIYIRTRGILISIVLVSVWLALLTKYFLQYAIHGTWTMLQYSPGVLWFNFNLIAIKESKWRKALKITLKPNPLMEHYCNGVNQFDT